MRMRHMACLHHKSKISKTHHDLLGVAAGITITSKHLTCKLPVPQALRMQGRGHAGQAAHAPLFCIKSQVYKIPFPCFSHAYLQGLTFSSTRDPNNLPQRSMIALLCTVHQRSRSGRRAKAHAPVLHTGLSYMYCTGTKKKKVVVRPAKGQAAKHNWHCAHAFRAMSLCRIDPSPMIPSNLRFMGPFARQGASV